MAYLVFGFLFVLLVICVAILVNTLNDNAGDEDEDVIVPPPVRDRPEWLAALAPPQPGSREELPGVSEPAQPTTGASVPPEENIPAWYRPAAARPPRANRLRPDPEMKKIPPLLFEQPMFRLPYRRNTIPFPKLPPRPADPPPGAMMSMVEQINEILQENMAGTPLEKRDIQLLEDPLTAGVRVIVDQQHFPGIDAISDPEVKAALKAAIRQWEEEQD